VQATNDIRVGIIGAGRWGPNLLRLFAGNPRSSVSVVAERDPERLRRLADRFPGVRTTQDAREAIVADDVDAVVVVTPTSTHEELVRAALEAGKHVLVEKPITNDSRSAEELTALAEHEGLVLCVGHTFLYNPAIRRVKEELEHGTLGRVFYVAMERTNLGPIRGDVNAAWDLAAHDVSIANFWLDAEPTSASAVGGAWVNPGVADAVFATLRYPGDVLVNIHTSWLHPRKARDIAVVGERRMLTVDDMDLTEPIRIYDKNVSDEVTSARFADSFAEFRSSVREGDIVIPKLNMGEPLSAEVDEFVGAVAEGRAPLTDGHVGIAVVRALEAISRSMDAGGAEQAVQGAGVGARG
jgi:predicted dehydrogenase